MSSKWLRTGLGTLLSVVLAAMLAVVFSRSTWRGVLPLFFVAVLVLLSRRFGVAVSLLGSALAAIIFAHTLYAPVGSVRVESDAARANLAWMILSAVAVSYLLYPPTPLGGPPQK